MTFRERKKIFKELMEKYPDLSWKPYLIPLMRVGFKFYRNFKVNVSFEDKIPEDGVVLFPQNHCNFYDSMVAEKALRGNYYTCFASDEPRGTFQASGFEGLSVVWVNRDDKQSRKNSSEILIELLKHNCNLSWCPEALWNLSDNRLMLKMSYGLAKAAIEGSKYNKVYIMPMVTNYNYEYKKEKLRVSSADVDMCKLIEVKPDMDAKELTEIIEDTMWTKRWQQLERNVDNSKDRVHYESLYGSDYVFSRDKLSNSEWNEFISGLKGMYPILDWEKEMQYEIKSKEQREQEEIMRTLDLIELKQGIESFDRSRANDEVRREHLKRVRKR